MQEYKSAARHSGLRPFLHPSPVSDIFISLNYRRNDYIGNGEKYRQRPSYEVISLSDIGKMPISAKYLTISLDVAKCDIIQKSDKSCQTTRAHPF